MEEILIDIHTHKKYSAHNILFIRNFYAFKNILSTPKYKCSLSVHPYFSNSESFSYNLNAFEMIGECGLDRTIDIPILHQEKIFANQIQQANLFNLPMILHIVKANDLLLKYLPQIHVNCVIHDYLFKDHMFQELLKYDCVYFSLGKNFLRNPGKYLEIPLERIFFETDVMPLSIEIIYQKYCDVSGIEFRNLMKRIYSNYKLLKK